MQDLSANVVMPHVIFAERSAHEIYRLIGVSIYHSCIVYAHIEFLVARSINLHLNALSYLIFGG